jgi:hypothetical protein
MVGLVDRLGGGRGRGGARDVGDRGDVVPIDPVADAQEKRGHQQAEASAGCGYGKGIVDEQGEIGHERLPAGG